MGEVYLAEDTLLGREVALKRLLPIFAEDEDFVSRFKREARAISSLIHPGLVRIHSLDWIDGVLLLDMEYVRGTSLLRVMQDSVVTPQLVARLAHDVLDALAECHENGIVHRDIKPSNILFDESMRAKVVDFGIATALADSTATQLREERSTTVVLGTPRFMAPEAWDGAPVTGRWDLFALGVVLFECLSGEAAFKATTTTALAKQITNVPLPRIVSLAPKVSLQLADLVDRLVLIDPAQRFGSAREALAALETAPELSKPPAGSTVRRSAKKSLARALRKTRSKARVIGAGEKKLRPLPALLAILLFLPATYLGILWFGAASPSRPTSTEAPPALALGLAEELAFTAKTLRQGDETDWHWWLGRGSAKDGRPIFGYSARGVLRMTMTETATGLRFVGEWAGYSSPLARGFEQGPVMGAGRWHENRRSLAAELRFENAGAHTIRNQSFMVDPNADFRSRVEFFRGMEASDLAPALIFNELAARNASLGQALALALPASGTRVVVPRLRGASAPNVDGVLDEPTWQNPVYGGSGRIGELLGPSGARAMFRSGQDGLFVALSVPAAAGHQQIQADIALMFAVSHPPQLAPRARLRISNAGVVDRAFYDGERELPFPDPERWQISSRNAESRWTAELFVPGSVGGAPWRFNFLVQGSSPGGEAVTLVQWGEMDTMQLVHGALLEFERAGS